MLSFYKISNSYGKSKGNYLNSIIINLFYLVLIIPGLYLAYDPQLSRYWFFILLLIYLLIYSRLYRLTKINLLYKATVKLRAYGGTGRHASLRNWSRKRYKFESCYAHQNIMKVEVNQKKVLGLFYL